jgi:hypothetical protein
LNYYPFGLTYHSYSRENSVSNKYKFQGQEHIDDLDLGWDSFKWSVIPAITISLFMASCDNTVSISDLKNKIYTYDELPDSVKLLFVHAKQYANVSGSTSLLYLDSSVRYTLTSSKSFGPFIDTMK